MDLKELAKKIDSAIKNRREYELFFAWTNHYTYRETSEIEDICNLCAILNDKEKFEKYSIYQNFRKWWNPNYESICRSQRS